MAADARAADVTIGPYRIGPEAPTLIVAEAGVNHDGRLDAALRLVDAAADSGADAVKFQMFRAEDLATASAPTASYQRQRGGNELTQREMLKRLELTDEAFPRIRDHCAARSILFLATPFSSSDIDRLVALRVAAIKIASTDLTNSPLLTAAASTGLSMIVSTGASTHDEIGEAVERIRNDGAGKRLILLHCVSCYPTPIEAINLRAMRSLQASFRVPVGLSDHTTSTDTGAWAVAAGACVLEKHFTLDPSAPGPDHAMSLSPPRLTDYVQRVRQVERAMGSGRLGMSAVEYGVRSVASRSIVAATEIPAGAHITRAALTLKRPGTGIPPRDLDRLVGRIAASDISCDTLLSWDMVR